MMQMKCNFNNVIFYGVYAVVAGGCDWPLPRAVGLSNNDVIALRALSQFRYVPYDVAWVALDGNNA